MPGKNILVPWSGGLDSTYVVYKNLSEGNNVYATYFGFNNSGSKTEFEKNARRIMQGSIDELIGDNKNYGQLIIHDGVMDVGYDTSKISDAFFIQPYSWVIQLVPILSGIRYDIDEIHIAYCRNDDALSYLDEINALYSACKGFMYQESKADDVRKLPEKVNFPIIKMPKDTIWKELPKQVRNNIFFCEDGCNKHRTDVCGRCKPCIRFAKEVCGCYNTLDNKSVIRSILTTMGQMDEYRNWSNKYSADTEHIKSVIKGERDAECDNDMAKLPEIMEISENLKKEPERRDDSKGEN